MSRRGFVLITVLWLVVVLSLVAGLSLDTTRLGTFATRNRVLLLRAAWARNACHEILLARYAEHPAIRTVDTIDLGRGNWCYAVLEDVGGKLDVNLATGAMLASVLGNDTLADAVLDWRDADDVPRPLGAEATWYHVHGQRLPRNGPLASVRELRYVRGFDSAQVDALDGFLTTRSSGRLNLNAAPIKVLLAVPGLSPEAVEVIRGVRSAGRRIASHEELLEQLSPAARQILLDHYDEFTQTVGLEADRFVALVEGGVQGSPLTSRGWLTVASIAGRLAVIRQEME